MFHHYRIPQGCAVYRYKKNTVVIEVTAGCRLVKYCGIPSGGIDG